MIHASYVLGFEAPLFSLYTGQRLCSALDIHEGKFTGKRRPCLQKRMNNGPGKNGKHMVSNGQRRGTFHICFIDLTRELFQVMLGLIDK